MKNIKKFEKKVETVKQKEKKIFAKYAMLAGKKNQQSSDIRVAGGLIEGSCCCSSS